MDSTIPSYYADERPELAAYVKDTRRWWDAESANYEVWVSETTIEELKRGEHPYQARILDFAGKFPILPVNPVVKEVVKAYLLHRLMPASMEGDAAHLAYASVFGFDYLLTWNCNHLANANKVRHIEVINGRLGLSTPAIVTPQMLVKEQP